MDGTTAVHADSLGIPLLCTPNAVRFNLDQHPS